MRILIINWQDIKNPQSGGAEVHLHEIFRRIVYWGHEATLLCCSYPGGASEEIVDGIRIIRRGDRNAFNYMVPLIYQKIRREGYDVVVEDINKIPFFSPVYAKEPVMVIVPHLFGRTIFKETTFPLASYVYLMELFIPLVYSSCIFEAISESTREDLIRRGIPREKTFTVHCGIDHNKYTPVIETHRNHQPTVLYLGRLKRYKSVQVLIKAMVIVRREFPEVRLLIVGEGDYRGHLERLSQSLGVEGSVEFMGFVSEEKKLDLLRKADVVVNPSPKEGWGLTDIEANACGTPVIASDVPGLRDSILDGETGFLFNYGDVEELSEKVTRVLSDEELRKRFSEGAVAWAQRFDWDRSAEETLDALTQVVREGERKSAKLKG